MRSNKNIKKYGKAPYNTVLVHGGPGAAGEMRPVAEILGEKNGVIEALQTSRSVNGQISELREILLNSTYSPSTVIGYSWGAWLAFMTAARYPNLIKKLILVSSAPFTTQYANVIKNTRYERLSEKSKIKIKKINQKIFRSTDIEKQQLFIDMGKIYEESDTYEKGFSGATDIDYRVDIFQEVWKEAEDIRKSGTLIKLGKLIKCSIVIIHGKYDPHPFEGVVKPLFTTLPNLSVYLIENCGHTPWIERYAKDEFYKIISKEISKN